MAWYDRFLGINREETEEKLNPSQYVISRNEGMTIDSREIVTNYRNAYEDLEVVNRAVNMIVDDVAEIPFWKQAEDCHCIVTCISICAVEAQLMGIPTISDTRSFASDISSTVLEEIENPKQVDTSQWFYNLAYSQFTHKEIESGFAYEIIKNA